MFPLFETIRIENGTPLHLQYHEERMARSTMHLLGKRITFSLSSIIQVPEEYKTGVVRCNVRYGERVDGISFSPYSKSRVSNLKLVDGDEIDYSNKCIDRAHLHALFERRGSCDEIIIVKRGYLTDTSISNLVFLDGTTWYTPAMPLLQGTCRARLLDEGVILARAIHADELRTFQAVCLINAMRLFNLEDMIAIDQVFH